MVHAQSGRPCRVLVTAFGRFPGVPHNPTLTLLDGLARQRRRLSRLGIDLHTLSLAVRYDDLADRLRRAAAEIEPDVIVLLGVAGRRRRVCVETRAINYAHPLRPDAGRACPPRDLRLAGPAALKATWPAERIRAAIAAEGVPVRASRDAGAYVCNAALYHALDGKLAPLIGFLHVPHPRQRRAQSKTDQRQTGAARPGEADLLRAVLATLRATRMRLW